MTVVSPYPISACRRQIGARCPSRSWSNRRQEGENVTHQTPGDIVKVKRADLEAAWTETRFLDPHEHRKTCSRIAIGRAMNLQTLITFDFWEEDAARLAPVWDEVLRSVELGRYVDDPTRGDVLS
jgi:hypothetical protein